MNQDERRPTRKRTRRARAALIYFRRRCMRACNRFQSAQDWYDKVTGYVRPSSTSLAMTFHSELERGSRVPQPFPIMVSRTFTRPVSY